MERGGIGWEAQLFFFPILDEGPSANAVSGVIDEVGEFSDQTSDIARWTLDEEDRFLESDPFGSEQFRDFGTTSVDSHVVSDNPSGHRGFQCESEIKNLLQGVGN